MPATYTVRRFDRSRVTYQDALVVTEVMMDSFKNESANGYVLGNRYRAFRDPIGLWTATGRPQTKLAEYEQRICDYNWELRKAARRNFKYMLDPRASWYGAYDTTGALVAVGSWYLPAQAAVSESTRDRIRRWIYQAWYWAVDQIAYVTNWRQASGMAERWTRSMAKLAHDERAILGSIDKVNELAVMSDKELSDANYPAEYMNYVRYLAIATQHQRKGIGRLVFTQMIDDIPQTPAIFKSRDGSCYATGPTKSYLLGTPEGVGLYQKLGYTSLGIVGLNDDQGSYMFTYHLMTRVHA